MMCQSAKTDCGWHHCYILITTLLLALSSYVESASVCPTYLSNSWPDFDQQDINNFLQNYGPKRSIATLAKNGQLPTLGAPHDDDEETNNHEDKQKRNLASIRKFHNLSPKRNIESLAKSGNRNGKRDIDYGFDKRNIDALARNGYLQQNQDKRDGASEEEYFNPFFQNPAPPSEVDGQQYNYQHSSKPSFLPFYPQSIYDKRDLASLSRNDYYMDQNYEPQADVSSNLGYYNDYMNKRSDVGLPTHGIYRQKVSDGADPMKRYIMSFPDFIYNNEEVPINQNQKVDLDKKSVDDINLYKRHIGSLARLGLLPAFRSSSNRYMRSGRGQLYVPTGFNRYRKYTTNKNLRVGEYVATKGSAPPNTYYSSLPSPAISSDEIKATYVRGRPIERIADNELPHQDQPQHLKDIDQKEFPKPYLKAIAKNLWEVETLQPRYYNFKSLRIPNTMFRRRNSTKRFLLLPAIDNMLLRKSSTSLNKNQ